MNRNDVEKILNDRKLAATPTADYFSKSSGSFLLSSIFPPWLEYSDESLWNHFDDTEDDDRSGTIINHRLRHPKSCVVPNLASQIIHDIYLIFEEFEIRFLHAVKYLIW